MALGLVLISMIGAASVAVTMFVYQFPLWMVLLAYPVTGTLILLPGVLLFAWVKQYPPEGRSSQLLTSQSPSAQRPPSTAGSSNP
jgi:hypothetical protein